MKLLYDVSVLGIAEFNPLAKTGVARVVENLLQELTQLNTCNLSLCTSFTQLHPVANAVHSLNVLQHSLAYCAKHQTFRSIPFQHSPQLIQTTRKLIQSLQCLHHYQKTSGLEISPVQESILGSLKQLQQLPWLINTNNNSFDIFHATFYPIPDELRNQTKILKFLTIYDLIPILYPQWFGQSENNRNTQTLDSLDIDRDWVFSISHATKDDLCNYLPKLNPDRVIVTHLAADPQRFYRCTDTNQIFNTKKRYSIPQGQYLLGLSTLEPRKNLPHLVRCFTQVAIEQDLQDLSLVLVGNPGWGFQELLDEISQSHPAIKKRIILTGRVKDEDLPALYSGATAFIYPSLYEGFGLPPLEAMRCGTPVITSNTSSLPEVVGDAAIVISPLDSDALCQSIYELYKSPELQQDLSTKGLKQSEKFNWKCTAHKTYEAYQYALSFI